MKYTEKKENGLTKMWNVIKSLAFSLVGMFSPFIQNDRVCVRSFVCVHRPTRQCALGFMYSARVHVHVHVRVEK